MKLLAPMREMGALLSPEKKNVFLVLYLLGFALFSVVLRIYPPSSILVLFLYPVGALLFGYATNDSIRAFFAGILSYAFLPLMILLSPGFEGAALSPSYLLWFAAYHLILLFIPGLIGYLASKKERIPLVLALALSALWPVLILSGIS